MDIDEYIDGMPILLLDGREAAHNGGFKGGWNSQMDKWVGKEVIPQEAVRNGLGHIEVFLIHDKDSKCCWYWDSRFAEVVGKYSQVSEEDFDSILN